MNAKSRVALGVAVVGLLVSRCNQEPQRILAHPLERDGINLDRDSAGATSALTDERQQFTLLLNTLLKIRDVDLDLVAFRQEAQIKRAQIAVISDP